MGGTNGIIVLVIAVEPESEVEIQLQSRRRRSSGESLVSPCSTEMLTECAVTSPRQHRQGLKLLSPLGDQLQEQRW